MAIELRDLRPNDLPAARAVLAAACAFDAAAEVADEKLFGAAPAPAGCAAFGAIDERGELTGVCAASGRWIRLLAVAPPARGRGIGTLLLAAAESAVAAAGERRARTMDQPGNYLAPGVDARNAEALAWLERRGYRPAGEHLNLIVDVLGNPRVTAERRDELAARAAGRGYEIRRAQAGDRAPLTAAVTLAFGRSWGFEVDRALDLEPCGAHVAFERTSGEIAAFAAHDANNRGLGWFGPAATFEAHRGRGLGEALLLACLMDVADAGLTTSTISWIGPRTFYERCAGVSGERRFLVLEKELDRS